MTKPEDNEKTARKNILRSAEDVAGISIKGYDFDLGVDYKKILQSFSTTGFQASLFSKAVEITNKMIKEKAFIYLGYTSNMVSSGLRDVFRYLVKHKMVDVVVTTAGGVEEDIIKCLGNFVLGEFRASGKELRERGINRIGNIFVSNNGYVEFESFFQKVLDEIYEEQKRTGKVHAPYEIVWKLGQKIADERSICYWAWKNKIKIFCPAITDGALGDNVWFFKYKNQGFKIDVAEEIMQMNDTVFGKKKTGAIILGSGVVKHQILNANMFRNGLDYTVYINNSQEFDGSDAGALPDEAVSWGKIQANAESVKVFGDATILFPLLVAESFAKEKK